MAVNKVVYGTTVLVDLTADTVTADTMLSGTTAHDKSGNAVTGEIAINTSNSRVSMGVRVPTMTLPEGYYKNGITANVQYEELTITPTFDIIYYGKSYSNDGSMPGNFYSSVTVSPVPESELNRVLAALTETADAAAGDIVAGKTAYVAGEKVEGTLAVTHVEVVTTAPTATSGKDGYLYIKLEG